MSSTEVINLEKIVYSNDSNDPEIKKLKEKINKIIGYKHYNTIRINITGCTITNKLIDLISDSKINIITNIETSNIIIEGDEGNDIDNLHNSESVIDGSVDGNSENSLDGSVNGDGDENMTNKSIYKKIISIRTRYPEDTLKLIVLYPKIYFYIEIIQFIPDVSLYLSKIADLLSFCNVHLTGNVGINLFGISNLKEDYTRVEEEKFEKNLEDLIDKFVEERTNNKNKITINCDEKLSKTNLYKFLIKLLSKYDNPNKFVCKKNIEYQKIRKTQKKLLHNNEVNNNSSINSPKISAEILDIYQRFIKNYEDSLFMNYSKVSNPKDRANFYIKSIIDKINWALYEDEKPTTELFIKKLINSALKFRKNIDTFPKQINYIGTHGSPLLEIKKVPSNCIIIFLTPINRVNTTIEYYAQILDLIKTQDFYENFIKNPICYGKKNWNELFTNSIVLLPNQYYYDLALSVSPKDEEIFKHSMGIYSSSDNFQRKRYDTLHTTLSTEIIKNNFKGLIILDGCRALNQEIKTRLPLSETVNIYRYEHLIKILNKSIWFDNDKDYYNCDKIDKIKNSLDFKKNTKKNYWNNKNNVRNLVKDENRSVGITIDLLLRIGFCKELILFFENINLQEIKNIDCKLLFNQIEEIFDNNPEALTSIFNLFYYINISNENYKYIINKLKSISKLSTYFGLLHSFFLYVNITTNKYYKEMQIQKKIQEKQINQKIQIRLLFLINLQLTDKQLNQILNENNEFFETLGIEEFYLVNNNIRKIPFILYAYPYYRLRLLVLDGNPITFVNTLSNDYISENNIEEIKKTADGTVNHPWRNIEVCKYIVELYKNYKRKINNKPNKSRFSTKEESRKSHIQKMKSSRRSISRNTTRKSISRNTTRHTTRHTTRNTTRNTTRHTSRQPTIKYKI